MDARLAGYDDGMPKTVTDDVGQQPSPLKEFVREYKSRRENEFDSLPFDQQIVRLKETVRYLMGRCEGAERDLLIANTTATNLHSVIDERQAAVTAWRERWCELKTVEGYLLARIEALERALRDLCGAIPDETVKADPALGVWLNAGMAALQPSEEA